MLCILATATIGGWHLSCSELPIIRLLYKGIHYARAFTMQGDSLCKGSHYARAVTMQGQSLCKGSGSDQRCRVSVCNLWHSHSTCVHLIPLLPLHRSRPVSHEVAAQGPTSLMPPWAAGIYYKRAALATCMWWHQRSTILLVPVTWSHPFLAGRDPCHLSWCGLMVSSV